MNRVVSGINCFMYNNPFSNNNKSSIKFESVSKDFLEILRRNKLIRKINVTVSIY